MNSKAKYAMRRVAVALISNATSIEGINTNLSDILEIDYVNRTPEEDDIVIAGNNCTIFLEDLDNCTIIGNNIKVDNYVLHLK
jgi:hypothetical protein